MWWGLEIDEGLVLRFLLTFARFEYALKRGGYLRGDRSWAAPDWLTFAKSRDPKCLERGGSTLREAVDYLLSSPPKRQVIQEDDTLGWMDRKRPDGYNDVTWVVTSVKTVRNNLFHGGKFPVPDGSVPEPARDKRLLSSSLIVLEHLRDESTEIDRWFAFEL